MRIPKRQDELDALTRKYLREPKDEHAQGQRHDRHTGVLSDEEIVAKLRGAKNAAKFSDLNDAGDTSAYDGDESRADLAIMGMYAFYTQDQAQLERLFGDSALGQRPKWRNRPNYRRRTIDKALSLVTETYTPPRSRSQSPGSTGVSYDGAEDLKQSIQALSFSGREKPGPREWLADNIIWRRHATSWFGEGGVAKALLDGLRRQDGTRPLPRLRARRRRATPPCLRPRRRHGAQGHTGELLLPECGDFAAIGGIQDSGRGVPSSGHRPRDRGLRRVCARG